jgi:hypothetical protein
MDSTKNNARKVWAAIVRHAKEHHESVNAAVDAYYPSPSPRSSPVSSARSPSVVSFSTASSSSSPRQSFEKPHRPEPSARRSSLEKLWHGVKKHARDHHESVSAAYATYYKPLHGNTQY